jgi:excisionase family DNA binding protein
MKRDGKQVIENFQFWTVPEAAEYLKVRPGRVLILIREGKIPYQKMGCAYLVSIAGLKKFVDDSWIVKTPRTKSTAKVSTDTAKPEDCPQPMQTPALHAAPTAQ